MANVNDHAFKSSVGDKVTIVRRSDAVGAALGSAFAARPILPGHFAQLVRELDAIT